MPEPIYTPANCQAAYQLDWSYSLFWHTAPAGLDCFEELRQLCEQDHVRILQHTFAAANVSQFLISTQPQVAPLLIAQRVKGRLQHLVRSDHPRAFRRNYSLRSIGSTKRAKLDQYLGNQLARHPMADARVQERLRRYQIYRPKVDLSAARQTSHAIYWYNLHLVFVNQERLIDVSEASLRPMHAMILKVASKKGHLLSRAAVVGDHIHMTLGCALEDSPEQVALAYMNNLAFACGMRPMFSFSYYAGTFSEYDLGVIPPP